MLSHYPSIIKTVHPIPNFSSSVSPNIPPTYSAQTIANFSCVPYFIYNNNRDHPEAQILNQFFGYICTPLSQFISIWYKSKERPPESVIIGILLCWKLVFLKCEKVVNNKYEKVMKDIFLKLFQFTFPTSIPSNKRVIMQSEEILFHTINVWIAFFLHIFPKEHLYKNVFLSNEMKSSFGYFTSNVLDLLKNDNKFIRNTSLKLHCIYLLVITCQYISRHCTQLCPRSITSILNNKDAINLYQRYLIDDIMNNEEMRLLKKCNSDGLDLLSAFLPGITLNLMTVIDDHYNNYIVKSKIISVSISALIYIISLVFNPIQKQQKQLYQKWKKHNDDDVQMDTFNPMDGVNLDALLSLNTSRECKPVIAKANGVQRSDRSNGSMDEWIKTMSRDVEWVNEARSKLSLVFLNLYCVISIEDKEEDEDEEKKEDESLFDVNWRKHRPKYASFFQHWTVRLSLIQNGIKTLMVCGALLDYKSLLIILEFLITEMKISLYSMDETHLISLLIDGVLKQYIFVDDNICNVLTQRLMDLIHAMPRFCKLQNDDRSLFNLKLIYGYLHILSPMYNKQNIISYILNQNKDNVMINHLLYCLSVNCQNINILESHYNVLSPITVIKYDESFISKIREDSIPMYYEINLMYFKNDECKDVLYKICQSIGYIITKTANKKRIIFKLRDIIDPLMESLDIVDQQNDSKRKQIQILLLIYNILIGSAKYLYKSGINPVKNELYSYFDGVIHVLLQYKYFSSPISNQSSLINYLYQSQSKKKKGKSSLHRSVILKDEYDESRLRVLNPKELSENAMIICLILRIFSSISYILMDANYFDKYLMIILYPMISKLSLTSNDLIHQSALSTMHHIAFINGYESFDDFIINNSDYIIDRISHQLNYRISSSYFSFNQISDNFDVFNSRTPQILRSLLSHTKSPSIVLPLLFDTIDHILNSLDALSRNTPSKVEHNAPITSSLKLDKKNGDRIRLDWKPSNTMTSALILTEKNSELQHDIARKLIIHQNNYNKTSSTVSLSNNDIKYIKNKMKQRWQLNCIKEYMMTLIAIIDTLYKKNTLNPQFIHNEESATFDSYLSYHKTKDFNDSDDLIKELHNYSNLLDGITPNDINEEKEKEKKEKEEDTDDPFYRKRPDEPSTEQALVQNIMKRCMHFVSSNVMEIKYLSLCIIEQSIFILSFRKKLLLPIIAEFWKSFTFVIDEQDKSIVLKCYDVVLVICNHCGGFIKRRFENDIWRNMKYNININWRMIKNRLSNTDLDKTIEVKLINQILKCLISLLTVHNTKEIDNKLKVRDIETVKIMFDRIANDIISVLIPLLNDIGTPICLVQNIIKVLSLFANIIDKQIIWFHLFMLNPQFMANYYDKKYLEIKQTELNDIKLLDLKQFVMDNVNTVCKTNFNMHLQALIKLID